MAVDANVATVLRNHLLADIESEHCATLRVIEACPEDKLGYKPHEKAMEFGAMAAHIYGSGPWFISIIKHTPPGGDMPKPPATKAELVAACKGMHEAFVAGVKALTIDELVAKHDFMGMFQEHGIILCTWHVKHLIHHRGQLQTYLRTMGAKCPSVYGGSADEQMGAGG